MYYNNNSVLIDHLKSGNEEAYEYLMNEYYSGLGAYALGLTKDKFKAEDIVQNVFFKVWKKRETLSEINSIKNFLYKSVYNEFIDDYRKNKNLTIMDESHINHLNTIVEDINPDEFLTLIDIVKKEIDNLPPKCKTIFKLAKFEGLTYREIAEYQNISLRTVENHMIKAFSIIRDKIGDKVEAILFLILHPFKKSNLEITPFFK